MSLTPPQYKQMKQFLESDQRVTLADGGRIRFQGGTNTKTGQGFQPGVSKANLKKRLDSYNDLRKTYGKEAVEEAFKNQLGVSFEEIATKKEYNGRTVTNIIDGFKKKIKGINRSSVTSPIYNEKTGHIYKTANRFGTFYSKNPGKNQYEPLTRTLEEVQAIIDNAPKIKKKNKVVEMNPKDLEGRSEYNNVEKKKGPAKVFVSRKELKKYEGKLNFKSVGKSILEDASKKNKARQAKDLARSNPTIFRKMSGKDGYQLSHLSLDELDSLKNLGYLPANVNIKSYFPFEKKIVDISKQIYELQNNPKLSIQEKRNLIAKKQREDRALRKQFPEYAKIKARLNVRATGLDSSGLMIKEKLPDPSIAIAPTEAGTRLKGTAVGSEKGKEILDIAQKKLIATLSNDPRCRINRFKGGRVGLQDGSASLNVCFRQGVDNINRGLPNPTSAQARNFGKVASLGRGVLKFGVLPEALFIAGESVIRMGMGDTLPEAIARASEYLLPGNQTKLADRMMLARTVGPKTAELILKANELRGFDNQIQNLENEKQFTGVLTDDGFDDNFFGQTKVEEENVIQNRIDALKNQKKSYTALTEAQYNFADMKAQEAEDIKTSNALFPKLLAKARSVQPDFDDPLAITSPTKALDLDLKMPNRFQRQFDLDARKPIFDQLVNTSDQQLTNLYKGGDFELMKSAKDYAKFYREQTVSEAAALNPEAMFSASTGLFFGEPVDKGVSYTPPPIDSIDEMEKEIIGQTNVANPFDIDRSSVATGLRGFSAAGGGIAKLAGVDSGPPPSSGPNSQGLQGLMKRVKRI